MVRDYRRRWLRTDLLAGITVTAYLVPQVMAYATVAGLPPVVGLGRSSPPAGVRPVRILAAHVDRTRVDHRTDVGGDGRTVGPGRCGALRGALGRASR